MTRITFSEFFNGVKGRLEGDQFKELEPSNLHFEHNGTYIALTYNVNSNMLWVAWVVGSGLDWAREIKRVCKHLGIETVGFRTKQESVKAIAKYFRATQEGENYFFHAKTVR